MADFCIPKQIAEKLKAAARAGEINIGKMYEMSSVERNALFSKYVDKEMAGQINAGFESAMISEQQTALKGWAEKVFKGGEKKSGRYRDIISKIDSLNEMGVLTPEGEKAFLSDLVAEKLGAMVTADEAKVISDKANTLSKLAETESEFGTPTGEYFKAKRDMQNYLDSLTPSSNLKVATSTIARGTMLLSVKSPLLNIESNTVQGLLQGLERRIAQGLGGGTNPGYAVKYMKFVNDVFKESGYDVSRMETLDTGRRMLGEDVVNTQGKGLVKKVGRFYEDIVFKKMMSAPDVWFSSAHFADSANIASSKFAKGNKEKALEIFKDATRIDPKTVEGQAVRSQAMTDAYYATYTNKSIYSDIGLGLRKLFNLPSGDLRIGDQIMPFVKTPANVIGAGIESSGALIPFDAMIRIGNFGRAIFKGESLREAAGENFTNFSRYIIRAGLGVTFAYLLSEMFDPDDYMGEYPVSAKERELLRFKNATPNSIKISGKWISLDYFGALGSAFVGFMYAKKYGRNLPEKVVQYYIGVGKQAVKLPGFDTFYSTIKSIQEAPDKAVKIRELSKEATNNIINFIRARTIPGLVTDFTKAMDKYERQINYEDAFSSSKVGIPGLRGGEQVKKNVFGDVVLSEGWWTVLFGARVKTANTEKIVTELSRLNTTGNLPAINDLFKSSVRADYFRKQVSNKDFMEAQDTFKKYFKEDLSDLILSDEYIDAPDDSERQKMINSVRQNAFNNTLDEYGYEEPDDEEKKAIRAEE